MSDPNALEQLTARIESASQLDDFAAQIRPPLQKALSIPKLRDILSGKPIGHPAHPALIAVPLGCWTGALVLDWTGDRDAARRLVGAGLVAFVPSALTGWSDWLDTDKAEQRVGLVHAASNVTAAVMYLGSYRSRKKGHHRRGVLFGAVGATALTVGGWLGGHLAYRLGIGVDTNVFDATPLDEWKTVEGTAPGEGEIAAVEVGGNRIFVTRKAGRLKALGNRCSHRGAPLSEGTLEGGCVTCPWHGSRFDLDTGAVERGPASAPQPVYEVDESAGGYRVRRRSPRSLANSTPA